jgi:hypothetical protein
MILLGVLRVAFDTLSLPLRKGEWDNFVPVQLVDLEMPRKMKKMVFFVIVLYVRIEIDSARTNMYLQEEGLSRLLLGKFEKL